MNVVAFVDGLGKRSKISHCLNCMKANNRHSEKNTSEKSDWGPVDTIHQSVLKHPIFSHMWHKLNKLCVMINI